MTNEELKLKIQALVDNELPPEEIEPVMKTIEGNYELRTEYVELKKLMHTMAGLQYPKPKEEWFQKLARRPVRRLFNGLGLWAFIASYLLLVGYALYTFFSDPGEALLPKLFAGGLILSILLLAGVTIRDRLVESKDDKYKGVMK